MTAQQHPQWQPPKKKHTARNVLLGIASAIAAIVLLSAVASGANRTSSAPGTSSYTTAPVQTPTSAPASATTQTTAPAQVTYACTGNAPGGIDITYGPEGSNYSATQLPFSKTVPLDASAGYYATEAQLSGSGQVTCTTTVQMNDGSQTVNTASASGDYNIANAEVCSNFEGTWQKC